MNHKTKIRLRIAIVAIIAFSLLFLAWKQRPNISLFDEEGFSEKKGLFDNAGLVDAESAEAIERETAELARITGTWLAVCTVRNTQSYKPDIYARRIFDAWDPMDAEKGEKVILFLARDEGWLSIERSLGLEFVLTEDFCDGMLKEKVIPLLNKANEEIGKKLSKGEPIDGSHNIFVGSAMLSGVKDIRNRIEKAFFEQAHAKIPEGVASDSLPSWRSRAIFTAVLALFLALGGIWLGFTKRCQRCGSRLNIRVNTIRQVGGDNHGLKEVTFKCFRCGYIRKKKHIIFPGSRTKN